MINDERDSRREKNEERKSSGFSGLILYFGFSIRGEEEEERTEFGSDGDPMGILRKEKGKILKSQF